MGFTYNPIPASKGKPNYDIIKNLVGQLITNSVTSNLPLIIHGWTYMVLPPEVYNLYCATFFLFWTTQGRCQYI